MKRGFTLTELLVCIAILFMLLALIVPVFNVGKSEFEGTIVQHVLGEKAFIAREYGDCYIVRMRDGSEEMWKKSEVTFPEIERKN